MANQAGQSSSSRSREESPDPFPQPFVPTRLFELNWEQLIPEALKAGLPGARSKSTRKDETIAKVWRHKQGLKPLPSGRAPGVSSYYKYDIEELADGIHDRLDDLAKKNVIIPDKFVTVVKNVNSSTWGKDFFIALMIEYDYNQWQSGTGSFVVRDFDKIWEYNKGALPNFKHVHPKHAHPLHPNPQTSQSQSERPATPQQDTALANLSTPDSELTDLIETPKLVCSPVLNADHSSPPRDVSYFNRRAIRGGRSSHGSSRRNSHPSVAGPTGTQFAGSLPTPALSTTSNKRSASSAAEVRDSTKKVKTNEARNNSDISVRKFLSDHGYDEPKIVIHCGSKEHTKILTFPLKLFAAKSSVVRERATALRASKKDEMIQLYHIGVKVEHVARLLQYIQTGTTEFGTMELGPEVLLFHFLKFALLVHEYKLTDAHTFIRDRISNLLRENPAALTPPVLAEFSFSDCEPNPCPLRTFLLRFAANRSLAGHGFLAEQDSVPGFSKVVAEVSLNMVRTVTVNGSKKTWVDDTIGHSFST